MEFGDILKFNASRKLIVQSKLYLDLLSDLKEDFDAQLGRLKATFQKIEEDLEGRIHLAHLVDQADWLDEDKMRRLRKKILDKANDLKREVEAEFEKYEVSIKQQ